MSKHLKQVYEAQLLSKSHREKTVQQYEADIARLACLAKLPNCLSEHKKANDSLCFCKGTDGLSHGALRLVRCQTLHDALAYAVEFEAVKLVSRNHMQVRQVKCAENFPIRTNGSTA